MIRHVRCVVFFFQAEDGIRDLVRSRGLGDVYKRQRGHLGEFLDEHGALGAQVLHDELVVHDLVAHVDGLSLIHI